MAIDTTKDKPNAYDETVKGFVADVKTRFKTLESEISKRNQKITERDNYIYGEGLESALNIPLGHDFTPLNWLRRTVEIHKNMFMSRGFQIVSTYDTEDIDNTTGEDLKRKQVENEKEKTYAEQRQQLIKAIQEDNGGDAFWAMLAESASAVGDAAIKMYYNEKDDKIELCPIESIENLYVLWSSNDFRRANAYAYIYQVSKVDAISDYGAPQDVATSQLGQPLDILTTNQENTDLSGQSMVTIMEVTGKLEGWKADKGRVVKCKVGEETEMNVMIVGNTITRLITDKKKLPKYYILPNKRQRRRPWGMSDVSDAAININLTYIETFSDWRTASAKINFQKFKAYGFGPDAQLPKPESRKIQYLPLVDGQDIQELQTSSVDGIDWGRQLDECKEQFVRETGLSRVLFDDPSVTLNSNQALLTSMKPTSDIAEAKKQLWGPIIKELFMDALEMVGDNKPELKPITESKDNNWTLRVMWPSVMQKEDPVYQSMLLNRFNANTMSLQSFLEAQGENKEEIDRLRSEMTDPVTAAILTKQGPLIAQTLIQAATVEIQQWIKAMLPEQQPEQAGTTAPATQQAAIIPGNEATGGVGLSPVSQPGTGASTTSPEGALATANQNAGR